MNREANTVTDKSPEAQASVPHSDQPTPRRTGVLDNSRPITARGLYLALMLAVFTVLGLLLLAKLKLLLVLLFVAILIATSLAGPVSRLQSWGLPKPIAILTMFFATLVVFVGIIWWALPPLIGQLAEAVDSVPERADQFDRLQQRYGELSEKYPVLKKVEERGVSAATDFGSAITQALIELPAALMVVIFVVTSLLTLSFLMLMSWPKMRSEILRLTHPDHRRLLDFVLKEIGERIGSYFRAKIIVVFVVAVWMYIVLMFLGSSIALLVSIFAGLCEIIPRIGPLFGRFFLVLAVMPLGWKAMLVVFVAHTIIDNIKGSWLSPLIEGKQLNIHPLTALSAVIAGGMLMSWMGALIAVPVAAAIQVVIEEVVIPWRLRQLEMAEAMAYDDPNPEPSRDG